jgi:NADPH:quinone reductase-like Zn-dependent oxidoreductase
MKAITQSIYGSSAVLEYTDVAEPELGEHDVLVSIVAASVNFADWHFMTGVPKVARLALGLRAPKERVRGVDAAGTVVAVGLAVTRFAIGDEVFGAFDGAFAERARTHEKRVATKPATVGFDEASAVPMAAITALQGLRQGGLAPGQHVLVIGAGGGVGTFAVQLAVRAGASVTGVCSSGKLDLVRSLGAASVIDYARVDITAIGEKFDLILDIAGNRSLTSLRRILAPTGSLVIVGGERGGSIFGGLERNALAGLRSSKRGQKLLTLTAKENPDDLEALRGMLERGEIRAVIDDRYPFERAGAAIDRLAAGGVAGKIVLTRDPSPGQ